MPCTRNNTQSAVPRLADAPPTRAVVLAAGRGRRLRPHTDHVPKPLLQVDGKPLIDSTLEALARAGTKDVCLVVNYLEEQIRAHVADGDRWNLRVTYVRQANLLGTAAALHAASNFIIGPCFVLASDYSLDPTYLVELKAGYLESNADLYASLKVVPRAELEQRSSFLFDERGNIIELVEKPTADAAPSTIGASLIFVVPPTIRPYLDEHQMSERNEFELPTVLNRMLSDGFVMRGLLQASPREWTDNEIP